MFTTTFATDFECEIEDQKKKKLSGSCSQIKQGCASCCPDCKQNQNCPCSRASSCREPWSRILLSGCCCRRSSLISITLGLLTVIGGYLSFASLEQAAGQCLECPLEPCIRARWYGAGRLLLLCRWRLGPARFGSY